MLSLFSINEWFDFLKTRNTQEIKLTRQNQYTHFIFYTHHTLHTIHFILNPFYNLCCETRPKNSIGWFGQKISLPIGRQFFRRWNSLVNQLCLWKQWRRKSKKTHQNMFKSIMFAYDYFNSKALKAELDQDKTATVILDLRKTQWFLFNLCPITKIMIW